MEPTKQLPTSSGTAFSDKDRDSGNLSLSGKDAWDGAPVNAAWEEVNIFSYPCIWPRGRGWSSGAWICRRSKLEKTWGMMLSISQASQVDRRKLGSKQTLAWSRITQAPHPTVSSNFLRAWPLDHTSLDPTSGFIIFKLCSHGLISPNLSRLQL